MSDKTHDWPSSDTFESMTDAELLEHAVEVRKAKEDVLPADNDEDGRFAYMCDLRREHIRDILKARLANRNRDLDTAPDLDDYDGDLEAAVFGDRARTGASC